MSEASTSHMSRSTYAWVCKLRPYGIIVEPNVRLCMSESIKRDVCPGMSLFNNESFLDVSAQLADHTPEDVQPMHSGDSRDTLVWFRLCYLVLSW